ncbi:P-loop NTPase family protein [Streptomyces mirabilis]|uniref:hypothetical protein n=1 Tax=Streptomyces mirabilis TaxID=68239 RepID=UPI003684D786
MATTRTTTSRDIAAELAFLSRALKAPGLLGAADRLAERATAESWTHQEYLAACLQREVAARESHGGEGRIRAARFPARKTPQLSGVAVRKSCKIALQDAADASGRWQRLTLCPGHLFLAVSRCRVRAVQP